MQQEQKAVPKRIPLAEINDHGGDIIRQVHYTKEAVIVTAHKKPLAEIRPVEPKQSKEER